MGRKDGSPKRGRPGEQASEVKEGEVGIGAGKPQFWAASQHVPLALFFGRCRREPQRGEAACRRAFREGEALVSV